MKRTIELDAESERLLYRWAKTLETGSEEAALSLLASVFLHAFAAAPTEREADMVVQLKDRLLLLEIKANQTARIRSRPKVMGGDACIRDTRIPVWMLVAYKGQGMSDSDLLANYPGLNAADLSAAWDYFAGHSEEIEAQRKRHEEAA